MRNLFYLFVLVPIFFYSQKDTNWYAFYNKDSTKIGYKDSDGNIKIEPKFHTYFTNTVFKNVIAVMEYLPNGEFKTYYLNKSGKIFGEDNVYMAGTSDVEEDPVEYEGIIKFENSTTRKVGFFDYNGKIVIKDKYNDLTNFHDGIARGLRGATWPKCDPDKEDCEHLWWKGGRVFAINTKGIELFELPEIYSNEIDYRHPKINEKVDSQICTSYKGIDGNVYSFCNPEKDFNKWFRTQFLPDFKINKTVLPKYFYAFVASDDNDNPNEQAMWKNYKKEDYLKKKQKKVDAIFNQLVLGNFKESVMWEDYYFPENEQTKEDLSQNTQISFLCRAENDYSSNNSFKFTKIGEEYFITSAP